MFTITTETFAFSLSFQMEFSITQEWDGSPTNHDPVQLTLTQMEGGHGVSFKVTAPFFDDPPAPPTPPGEATPGLWEYEGQSVLVVWSSGVFTVKRLFL